MKAQNQLETIDACCMVLIGLGRVVNLGYGVRRLENAVNGLDHAI